MQATQRRLLSSCGVHLTKAVIIGRFPGFRSPNGADYSGSLQVCRVLHCCLLLGRRDTNDIVKET